MLFPENEQAIFVDGPVGQLQAIATPAAVDKQRACAVVCHPHPQMQGTMHNKVVTTLAKVLGLLGMPVLRFNYRGVDASDGEYDHGNGETDDALAALQWMQTCFPSREIWLAGFSFGGAIAVKAVSRFPCARLITVAPSVVHFALADEPEPTCPWWVVQGEDDEVVPSADVYAWLDALTVSPTLIKVPECGHFFHRKLIVLRDLLIESLICQP